MVLILGTDGIKSLKKGDWKQTQDGLDEELMFISGSSFLSFSC